MIRERKREKREREEKRNQNHSVRIVIPFLMFRKLES